MRKTKMRASQTLGRALPHSPTQGDSPPLASRRSHRHSPLVGAGRRRDKEEKEKKEKMDGKRDINSTVPIL